MTRPVASNCMVSHPILFPDKEIVSFNGLAWSNVYGMIHQSTETQQSNPAQWLGTND